MLRPAHDLQAGEALRHADGGLIVLDEVTPFTHDKVAPPFLALHLTPPECDAGRAPAQHQRLRGLRLFTAALRRARAGRRHTDPDERLAPSLRQQTDKESSHDQPATVPDDTRTGPHRP